MIYARTSHDSIQAKSRRPKVSATPEFSSTSRRRRPASTGTSPERLDGVKRLISYRVVDGFPLIAVVGISEAAVFKQWTQVSRIYLAIAGFLTLAILVGHRARRGARKAADGGEIRSRTRQSSGSTPRSTACRRGSPCTIASERLLLVNKRYLEMYGLTPDQMQPGDTIRKVFAQRSEGLVAGSRSKTISTTIIAGAPCRPAGRQVVERARRSVLCGLAAAGEDRRLGGDAPGRHRADPRRARGAAPGSPRCADRTDQPRAVPVARRPGSRAAGASMASASISCCSTSTASKPSTTRSVISPATACCGRSRFA